MADVPILTFLQHVQEEPYLYFRDTPSYEKLLNMISSYSMIAPVVDSASSFFMIAFANYICAYYGISGVLRGGLTIINLFTSSDEEAYCKFYELLGKFLATQTGQEVESE